MAKNIYLVGFMGVGKTTIGQILALKLKREFVEMDESIEAEEGKKIADIFEAKGEPHFRNLEKKLLLRLSKKNNLVVSCGGGLVCDKDNLKILKETGIMINLAASSETILERTKKYKTRPLLNVEDPHKKIKELLNLREPYYSQAHYSIETDKITPGDIVEKIITILNG